MSFIAKNPLTIPQIEEAPPAPIHGARGLFAKEDGWYDIDSMGRTKKLDGGSIDEEEIKEIVDAELEEAKASGEFNGKDGTDGVDGADGADGLTPYIAENGNWWIGTTDTGVKAMGIDGTNGVDGKDGLTPHIAENGNWWIGTTDMEVKAKGTDGADGFSPIATVEQTDEGATITITDKNGTTTTTVKNGEDGQDGLPGTDGKDGSDGQDGVGISDISCYESTESGGINQLNVLMSDGNLYNFYIRNGEKGDKGDTGEKGEQGERGADGEDLTEKPIETYTGTLDSNSVYKVTTGASMEFPVPIIFDSRKQNQVLVYLKTTATVDITWANGILFVGGNIPTIGTGNYRIIFEYNPNAEAWVVGVVQDGTVS